MVDVIYFYSGNTYASRTVAESFTADAPFCLSFFWDEKDMTQSLPSFRQDALFAPSYLSSCPFDPAFDILLGAERVYDGARTFAEAIVPDIDMQVAHDPMWTYNARTLFLNLYMAGVAVWEYVHTHTASQDAPLPSLTDTIFGMVDDMAMTRMQTTEAQYRNGELSYPSWWNLLGKDEKIFLRNTVLGAPLNTSGSLLAVVNSYTGRFTNTYTATKCTPLFSTYKPSHVKVFLPSINAQTFRVLLSCALFIWGHRATICVHNVSAWGQSFIMSLSDFMVSHPLRDMELLITTQSPVPAIEHVYNGTMAWGAQLSVNALTSFRRKVEETTGNPGGLLTSLPIETPAQLSENFYFELTEKGWELKSLDVSLFQRCSAMKSFALKPAETCQSEEVQRLKHIFAIEEKEVLNIKSDGTIFVSLSEPPVEESEKETRVKKQQEKRRGLLVNMHIPQEEAVTGKDSDNMDALDEWEHDMDMLDRMLSMETPASPPDNTTETEETREDNEKQSDHNNDECM